MKDELIICRVYSYELFHESFDLLRNISILHDACKILCTSSISEDWNNSSSMA